jgi:hypothetical protein
VVWTFWRHSPRIVVKPSYVVFGEALFPLWNWVERMEREKTCPNYQK